MGCLPPPAVTSNDNYENVPKFRLTVAGCLDSNEAGRWEGLCREHHLVVYGHRTGEPLGDQDFSPG